MSLVYNSGEKSLFEQRQSKTRFKHVSRLAAIIPMEWQHEKISRLWRALFLYPINKRSFYVFYVFKIGKYIWGSGMVLRSSSLLATPRGSGWNLAQGFFVGFILYLYKKLCVLKNNNKKIHPLKKRLKKHKIISFKGFKWKLWKWKICCRRRGEWVGI